MYAYRHVGSQTSNESRRVSAEEMLLELVKQVFNN